MAGNIYITGDKHGTLLPLLGLAEKQPVTAEDVLLIAGDAGFVWDVSYPQTVATLEKAFPGVIAFVDGNHENHALLNTLEEGEWMGGRIHRVGARIFHLMRGELYSIHRQTIFAFGGARSSDKSDRRIEGISWWREEEPSEEEMNRGMERVRAHLHEIDYVITHEPPLFARAHFTRQLAPEGEYRLPSLLDEWYTLLSASPRLKKWYFGHVHTGRVITPQLRALYNEILLMTEDRPVQWW